MLHLPQGWEHLSSHGCPQGSILKHCDGQSNSSGSAKHSISTSWPQSGKGLFTKTPHGPQLAEQGFGHWWPQLNISGHSLVHLILERSPSAIWQGSFSLWLQFGRTTITISSQRLHFFEQGFLHFRLRCESHGIFTQASRHLYWSTCSWSTGWHFVLQVWPQESSLLQMRLQPPLGACWKSSAVSTSIRLSSCIWQQRVSFRPSKPRLSMSVMIFLHNTFFVSLRIISIFPTQ